MSDYVCILITVLDGDALLRCALKLAIANMPDDCVKYYREEENMNFLRSMLPLHVKNCGPIVHVEEIFEVIDARMI